MKQFLSDLGERYGITRHLSHTRRVERIIESVNDRRTIIVDASNFPTDRYIVQGLAEQHGLTVVTLNNDGTGGHRRGYSTNSSVLVSSTRRHARQRQGHSKR
jgi:hypothetical protein